MFRHCFVCAVVIAVAAWTCHAQPSVPEGFQVEAYVSGLSNPNALAFSPGGEFGYEGDLFVGDSRPDSGTIYRATGKGQKTVFASAHDREPRSFAFAPVDSSLAPGLYVSGAYYLSRCNGPDDVEALEYVNAFRGDIGFAPSGSSWDDKLYLASRYVVHELFSYDSAGALESVAPVASDFEGFAFGPGGAWGHDLYCITADFEGGDSGIHTLSPDGALTPFTDSDLLVNPNQGAFSPEGIFGGDLYISDWGTDRIYSVSPDGSLSIFAEGLSFSSTPYHKLDGGDVVFGPDGAMYVADGGAGTIWRISEVPEPATLALLTMGSLTVLRRRRR